MFFSGIGGTAIGPLALIAQQAGFAVSGSDKQDSQYIHYLRAHGILDIHIGQDQEQIEQTHNDDPIDWYVYSSAVALENPDSAELRFCKEQGIKATKRDELINFVLREKNLKLLAIAGTHGKTTTTAMVIWLLKELGAPISYSLGAKIGFGEMGQYSKDSEYFVYECDEFDRNFLAFEPHLSLITGVSWDHHEIFPTREDYQLAFREFIDQSNGALMWLEDLEYLNFNPTNAIVLDPGDHAINSIKLAGLYNRLDAWLAVNAVRKISGASVEKLVDIINGFPGLQRRMEEIVPNLYTDYAHTPEKIRGAMSVALEMASDKGQEVVVIYEPLTNRRQHYIMNDYKDCFAGAAKVYWLPSYLAREDKSQRVIPPEELISHLANPDIAEASQKNDALKQVIVDHVNRGNMVVGMAGGGGGSLDEWLREEFKT